MAYSSSWRSPSNIALIKYWGKYGIQLPRNPSLSFTLSACHTNMTVQVIPEASIPELVVLYDGKPRQAFEVKIKSFFSRLAIQLPWLKNASVLIDSINTFPHGSGIASSASAMSALALCLADIDDQLHNRAPEKEDMWWRKISGMARLGSGSASRSVFPIAALWGVATGVPESSNEYAIHWGEHISDFYKNYQDTILIVSTKEKSVSSTLGHELMSGLAYADVRYGEAQKNLLQLIDAMSSDQDVDRFMSICESEAFQLHALMMSSASPFILMEPSTVAIIKEVWRFRKETNVPVCFTLDAGPNLHLLYPASFKEKVVDWIQSSLVQYCSDGMYIKDEVGSGPMKL